MTDIFNTDTPVTLDVFVGEGKKYADNDAVAKALIEKDRFIAQLQEENRQREAALQAAQNTKAFEDRLKALEAAQTLAPEPTGGQVAPPVTTTVDIDAKVQQAIAAREQQNLRTRNLMAVKDKLTEVFGADYPNKVKQRASELQISMDKLNELAADTPTAFFTMIGLNTAQTAPVSAAPPPSSFNSASITQTNTGEKGNSYYTKLRREKPTEYFTPRIAAEEYNQLKKLGPEKFYAI